MALLVDRLYLPSFLFQKEEVRPLPNLFGCELIEIGGGFKPCRYRRQAVVSSIVNKPKDFFVRSLLRAKTSTNSASNKRLTSLVCFNFGRALTVATENFGCECELATVKGLHRKALEFVNVNCLHVNDTFDQINCNFCLFLEEFGSVELVEANLSHFMIGKLACSHEFFAAGNPFALNTVPGGAVAFRSPHSPLC